MDLKSFIAKTTEKARSGVDKVSSTVRLHAKKSILLDKLDELYKTLGKMCYSNAIGESEACGDLNIDTVIREISDTKKELVKVEESIRDRSGKMICMQCGVELQKDASFCPHCGTRTDDIECIADEDELEDELVVEVDEE